MRAIYWAWSTVLFAAIVVQVGLAGYGAFYAANKLDDEGSTIDEDVFFDGFVAHALFGYVLILAALLLWSSVRLPASASGASGVTAFSSVCSFSRCSWPGSGSAFRRSGSSTRSTRS